MSRYPKYIYDGIAEDPSTWGSCKSKEEAMKYAENQYKKSRNESVKFYLYIIAYIILLALIYILRSG